MDLVDFISDPGGDVEKKSIRHRVKGESDKRSGGDLASVVADFLEKEKNNSQWETKKDK